MHTPRDTQILGLQRTIQGLTARVGELEALVARGVIAPVPGRLTVQQIRDARPNHSPYHEPDDQDRRR